MSGEYSESLGHRETSRLDKNGHESVKTGSTFRRKKYNTNLTVKDIPSVSYLVAIVHPHTRSERRPGEKTINQLS